MGIINEKRSPPEKMRAWAEVSCETIEALGKELKELDFFAERDDHRYERHTNLKGYPQPDDDPRNDAIYQFLASRSYYQRVREKDGTLQGSLEAPKAQ